MLLFPKAIHATVPERRPAGGLGGARRDRIGAGLLILSCALSVLLAAGRAGAHEVGLSRGR